MALAPDCLLLGLFDRQLDAHQRAFSGNAGNFNIAVMFGDDAVRDCQTQPGTAANGLGREEWIKDARQHIRRNTLAIITNCDPDVVAGLPGTDRDHPALCYRLTGVHENIQKHLIEFRRQTFNQRQIGESLDYLCFVLQFVRNNVQVDSSPKCISARTQTPRDYCVKSL